MVEGTRSEVTPRESVRRSDTHRGDEVRKEDTKRSVKEGIGFGLIAGAIFIVAWMLASVAAGQSAMGPFRMSAGVLFGAGALDYGAGSALLAGALVGIVLSAIFGAIYGLINARLPLDAHTNTGTQAVLGLVYGAVVWLVMMQIIARIAWPWFLDMNQLLMFILHVAFFGLPLGLMYAASERRALLRPGVARPAAQPGPA
jgi:hypothetical protein